MYKMIRLSLPLRY